MIIMFASVAPVERKTESSARWSGFGETTEDMEP